MFKKEEENENFTEKKTPNHHHKSFSLPSLRANYKVGRPTIKKVLEVIDIPNYEILRQRWSFSILGHLLFFLFVQLCY